MKRERRKTSIFSTVLVTLLLIYIAIDIRMVTSVKSTIRTLYLHPEQDQTMISDDRVTEEALNKFFRRGIYPLSEDEDTVVFRLSVGKGLHYLIGGTVWVNYTFIGIDPDTGLSRYGSSRVPIRLKVKLNHWHWTITDKHEEA